MSKAFLFVIGVALIAISANYFVSIGLLTLTAKSPNNTEKRSIQSRSVLSVSGAQAADKNIPVSTVTASPITVQAPSSQTVPPESTRPKVIPSAVNPADRLRSALESVVEESIEQELWDEVEPQSTETKEKIK